MKVLNLQCEHGHDFEGWFASEDDFQQQLERDQIACPFCGHNGVRKMLSAPRLNLGASALAEAPVEGEAALRHAAEGSMLQARWLRAMRELVAQTEDVGERFADQARAMHHGEIEQRNIRGQAAPAVAMELIEEGIGVIPLPALSAVKETLQ